MPCSRTDESKTTTKKARSFSTSLMIQERSSRPQRQQDIRHPEFNNEVQHSGMGDSHRTEVRSMARAYHHLSRAERDHLAVLRSRGLSLRAIARQLGRAPVTLSRELRRNAPPVHAGTTCPTRPKPERKHGDGQPCGSPGRAIPGCGPMAADSCDRAGRRS